VSAASVGECVEDEAEVKAIVAYLDAHTPSVRKARLRKYAETLVQMVGEEK